MLKSIEINCTTGEVIETPYTEQELEEVLQQQEINAQLIAEREAQRQADDAAKAAAKASAEAKLAALGLTPEEIAALQ